MIRDRGKMKWTAMMLPEHVKLLRDWAREDSYEQKIELDEQQLEVINQTISEAMELGETVTITHYRKHQYELVIGKIHHLDQSNQNLYLIDRFKDVHKISISSIADVQLT